LKAISGYLSGFAFCHFQQQQPSRDNEFTAVLQIRDPSGGAKDYEIEVTW